MCIQVIACMYFMSYNCISCAYSTPQACSHHHGILCKNTMLLLAPTIAADIRRRSTTDHCKCFNKIRHKKPKFNCVYSIIFADSYTCIIHFLFTTSSQWRWLYMWCKVDVKGQILLCVPQGVLGRTFADFLCHFRKLSEKTQVYTKIFGGKFEWHRRAEEDAGDGERDSSYLGATEIRMCCTLRPKNGARWLTFWVIGFSEDKCTFISQIDSHSYIRVTPSPVYFS